MKTRTYKLETRRRKQAELKARIAAAAAELHAARGVAGTSYADIGRHAGVSTPTVYSHFPTLDDLLQGCTGHVIARAPAMPAEEILAAPDLPAAAALLVAAMERQHLHFEPWSAWREDRVVPFLAVMATAVRQAHSDLVERLLARHNIRGGQREVVAAWESVLSFDFWYRLVRQHGLSRPAARRIQVQCLLAVLGPTAAPASIPRPGTEP